MGDSYRAGFSKDSGSNTTRGSGISASRDADNDGESRQETYVASKSSSSSVSSSSNSKSTQSSSSSSIRAATSEEIEQQNSTPSPIKPAYMKNAVESSKSTQSQSSESKHSKYSIKTDPMLNAVAESNKAQSASTSPHELYGSDPTEAVSIHTANKNKATRQVTETDYLSEESTSLKDEVSMSLENKIEKAQSSTKSAKIDKYIAQPGHDFGAYLQTEASDFQTEAQTKYGENDIIMREIAPRVLNTVIGGANLFLNIPAGLEIAAQKPKALATGLEVVALGTVDTALNDPGQLVSDILVSAYVGGAVGKVGRVIKTEIPTIGTGKQGVLLKTKIVDTPKVVTELDMNLITVGEYKGTSIGQDLFSYEKVINDIVTTETKPKASTDVLVGESKNGFTDIYTPITEQQANLISDKYYTNTRNIKTSEGSFLEVEITGEIPKSNIKAGDSTRITTNEPDLIGTINTGKNSGKLENMPRLETKVTLTRGILSKNNINLLGEGQIVDTTGRVITSIDDVFGNPTEPPIQLNSGYEKVNVRKSLSEDTSGIAYLDTTPDIKEVIRGYKLEEKPAFIDEMPAMNLKAVKVKKDVPSRVGDFDIQGLYDDAVKRGKDPNPIQDAINDNLFSLDRDPFKKSSPFKAIGVFPRVMSDSIQETALTPNNVPSPVNIPDIISYIEPDISPFAQSESKPSSSTKTPDITKDISVPVVGVPNILLPKKPKKLDIDINFDRKRSMFKGPVNIKRGTRKNKFGDINKILFGK